MGVTISINNYPWLSHIVKVLPQRLNALGNWIGRSKLKLNPRESELQCSQKLCDNITPKDQVITIQYITCIDTELLLDRQVKAIASHILVTSHI